MVHHPGAAGANASFKEGVPAATYRRHGGCDAWEDAQHVLWQGAQLCCAAAFLIPHRCAASPLLLRSLLTLSFFMTSVWAGLVVCAPDVLAWHLTCLLVNAAHAVYLAWEALPPRLPNELRGLYDRLFLPYQVGKKPFATLVRAAEILSLDGDHKYAVEGVSPADQKVSILLSGKLQVTCEDVLLHYVQPYEFIDSPEYESCPIGSDKLFQVSITAQESCRYLCWPRRRLYNVLRQNPTMGTILRNLVGRDIALKLYSLAEFHRLGADGPRLKEPPDWWRQTIPRSLSADAVYTEPKGRLRSLAWRATATADADDAVAKALLPRKPARAVPAAMHRTGSTGQSSLLYVCHARPATARQPAVTPPAGRNRCSIVRIGRNGKVTASVLPVDGNIAETSV